MNIMKNNNVKAAVDIVLYLIVFVLLQVIFLNGADLMGKHYGIDSAITMAAGTALSGLITIVIFLWRRWSPYSREYIATRPWTALAWVVLLSLGTIIPSQWMIEVLDVDMPKETLELMTKLLGTPWGYLAVGVLAPVAEEMVFRGAILRRLLEVMGEGRKWFAIIISALLFGALHANGPQFIHAALIGVLLGWMYSRTNSIVPGMLFHWINNTIAFVAYNMIHQAADGKLIDIFQGNQRSVYMALGFSLCIFLPSLFRLENIISASTQQASSNYDTLIGNLNQYRDIIQSNRSELHPVDEDLEGIDNADKASDDLNVM